MRGYSNSIARRLGVDDSGTAAPRLGVDDNGKAVLPVLLLDDMQIVDEFIFRVIRSFFPIVVFDQAIKPPQALG